MEQRGKGALQVASRVWERERLDLEAEKKEREFW